MSENKVQIGWYTQEKDEVVYNHSFETAAWYEQIAIKAGRYPMYVYDYRVLHFDVDGRKKFNGEISGHCDMAYIDIPGEIVSDYFGSLFGGVPVGSYDTEQNKGAKTNYNIYSRFYTIAESVLTDPETPYELFPEYIAVEEHGEWDGKPYTTYGIFVKGLMEECER